MQKRLGILRPGLLALVMLAVLAAGPGPLGKIKLAWDHPQAYPNGNSNWLYRIYISTDLTNWSVLTNLVATNTSVAFEIQRGAYFFYATTIDPSNYWGESDPSNGAQTPTPPPGARNLNAQRVPQ